MRFVVWAGRIIVFVLVLLFALKNTAPVSVHFFADHAIQSIPLIVVMLVAFALGAAVFCLFSLPSSLRRRRELARLKRDIQRLHEASASPAPKPVAPIIDAGL